MTTTTTKTYQVTVIERALAFYEVEAKDARTAAENWQDGEFDGRDDEALDSEGPCNVREQRPTALGKSLLNRNGKPNRRPAALGLNRTRSCCFTPITPTTAARRLSTLSSRAPTRSKPSPRHAGRRSPPRRAWRSIPMTSSRCWSRAVTITANHCSTNESFTNRARRLYDNLQCAHLP